MPRLKLEVDQETWQRVVDQADAERRPPVWQAEVLLRRAVGLPFPPQSAAPSTSSDGPTAA
jgi:hypothetical protein